MKTGIALRALEELKSMRSLGDLKILLEKSAYVMPRVLGNHARFTDKPPSLQIEPTNNCNLKCICCASQRSSRCRGYMDFGLFTEIIDEASSIGVKRIHLYLLGEPLLHPKIVDMIRFIKSRNMGINIATNGMLMDEEKAELILRSGLNVADHLLFSILGHSKEVHERIMIGAKQERVFSNIYTLLDMRRKLHMRGPIVETVFYMMPENQHEGEEFYQKWHGVVDHVRIVKRISQQFSRFGTEELHRITRRATTCTDLWERMTVYWNGDVTMCVADVNGTNIIGNLRDQSIEHTWKCESLMSIKRLHKERRFFEHPLCSKCDW
jgi:radical SAM protein with 4Fe4S-binding SPASM domain